MSHSAEQMKKKASARAEAIHHMMHSAVDGKRQAAPMSEPMYKAAPLPREQVKADSKNMPSMPPQQQDMG